MVPFIKGIFSRSFCASDKIETHREQKELCLRLQTSQYNNITVVIKYLGHNLKKLRMMMKPVDREPFI